MEYKTYNENKMDIYPSIGVCFTMAVKEENLNNYGYNITSKKYVEFLNGYVWDSNLMKVDYENVIQRLGDYIIAYGYTQSGVGKTYDDVVLYPTVRNGKIMWHQMAKMPGFKELSFLGMKCFTIDIPFRKGVHLNKFWLWLKPDIFLKGRRLSITTGSKITTFFQNRFIVQPHYPKQFLRYFSRGMRYWPKRDQAATKSYVMRLSFGAIEVLERRNKYMKPCDTSLADIDGEVEESILTKTGCKPPYWNSSSSLPLCTNQKEMIKASKLFYEMFYSNAKLEANLKLIPCRVLERVDYYAADVDFPNYLKRNTYLNGSVGIYFDFKEENYKEVKHVKSMDEQALIGN